MNGKVQAPGNRVALGRRSLQLAIFASLCLAAAPPLAAQENASNPLAKTNNTDIRFQYTDAETGYLGDGYIDGAFMARPNLKLKYELHYNWTDRSGSSESDFEKIVIKPIFFPSEHKLSEDWGVRTAIGLDWILDLGDVDKGIGVGADQIGPFGGLAFGRTSTGLTLIPLVQQYLSYNGETDINTTSARLIALQPFAQAYWVKLDAKVPYDWENDAWPATAEVQLGYNFSDRIAWYADGLVGIGNDRPYDAGAGLGLRFKY